MLRRLALASVTLWLLACERSPAEPREEFDLDTAVGRLAVTAPLSAASALLKGIDGAPGMCLQFAMQDLGRPAEAFRGALDGWRVVVSGASSSISPGARLMRVAGQPPEATQYGMRHECLTALAIALDTCTCCWQRADECYVFGPGLTVACEPC